MQGHLPRVVVLQVAVLQVSVPTNSLGLDLRAFTSMEDSPQPHRVKVTKRQKNSHQGRSCPPPYLIYHFAIIAINPLRQPFPVNSICGEN